MPLSDRNCESCSVSPATELTHDSLPCAEVARVSRDWVDDPVAAHASWMPREDRLKEGWLLLRARAA